MFRIVGVICILKIVSFTSVAQCVLDTQLLNPPADHAWADEYGSSIDTFEDYMLVGAIWNDSIEAGAGTAYLYKLDAANKWQRVARFSPSIVQESMQFGQHVAIHGTTIAISGIWWDVQGNPYSKVFLFEKDPSDEWESGTETYQLDLNTNSNTALALDLHHNLLAVSYWQNTATKVDIYKKTLNVFAFHQQITAPLDAAGQSREYGYHIAINDEVLVLSGAGFQSTPDYSHTGIVSLFTNSGGIWSASPAATLAPSDALSFDTFNFGVNVWLENDLIVVEAYRTGDGLSLYVYSRPVGGWGDMEEDAQILVGNEHINRLDITIEDDFIFVPRGDWAAIDIYKRYSPASISKVSVVSLPPTTSPGFRPLNVHSLSTTGNRLLVASTMNLFDRETSNLILDYSSNGDWEHGGMLNQQLRESSFNASDDLFGSDVDTNADVMIVGAPWDDANGIESGAAYVYAYRNKTWDLITKITSPRASVTDVFGTAVSVGDSTLFISAIEGDTYKSPDRPFGDNAGVVFVFKLTASGWQYHSDITAPEIKSPGGFGRDIVYDNGYVAISEFVTSDSERRGLVHIYKETEVGEWEFIATLRPSDDMRGDFFGRSIAMNDSTIVVGTGNVEYTFSYVMKAYVYQKKGEWKNAYEDARVVPAIYFPRSHFGYSVALFGDEIVVGAPGYPSALHSSSEYWNGAAYTFKRPAGGWYGTIHETARLLPSNPSKHNAFGYSVAIDEGEIYVGAPHTLPFYNVVDNFNNDDNQMKSGTVYRFLKNGEWVSTSQEDKQIQSLDPEWADGFGGKVIVRNSFLIIGAPLDDTDSGFKTGSVQTFMLGPKIASVETPCQEDGPVRLKAYPSGGLWNIPGLSTQTSGEFRLTPGEYTATYQVNGCTVDTTFQVISSGLNIFSHNAGEHAKCIDHQARLFLETNANASKYSWHFKLHEQDTAYQQIQVNTDEISVTEPGFYLVKISHENCKTYFQHFEVVNDPPVEIGIETPSTICSDEVVQMRALPLGGVWSGDVTVTDQSILDPANLSNGSYTETYTVATQLGCVFSKDIVLHVDKLMKPEIISSGNLLCFNEPVTLQLNTVDDNSSIHWLKLDDSPAEVGTNVKLEIRDPGLYTAEVSKHSCSLRSEPVKIDHQRDSLFVPNVFTPNADFYNDHFEVTGAGLNNFDIQVINRYGQQVYRTQQPDFKWSGDNVPGGIYYWYIRYQNCIREPKTFKGIVEVVK